MTAPLSAYRLARRAIDKAFAVSARRSFHAWGPGTVVQLPVKIEGESRIALGAGITIGEGSWLQALEAGTISIGDGCSFSGQAVISAACSITIADRVLMARNVHVLDHLHRCELLGVPVLEQGIASPAPVRIGRGAWVGANVVIMPGVAIGQGAVVGANSVVRTDVPAFTVAAGAPARIVRHLADTGVIANGAPAHVRR